MPSATVSVLKKKCRSFAIKVKVLRNKLKTKQSQTYRLKEKTSRFSTESVLRNLLKHKSSAVKTFINMQIFHKNGTKWSQAEKDLALSLHYKSPGTYKFMIQNLKFTLPSTRTIQNWLKVCNLRTGVKTNLTQKLFLKAQTMTEREKTCVVMFDELALKKMLEFNRYQDIIEGYQDLGKLGREEKLANTALVFLIRGLFHNWRIPFGYFVSAGPVNSDALQQIIVSVISALKNMSFNPKVIVCDQGSNNRKALALLGATKRNPMIDIGGEDIYSVFDTPHLLKSLRNNFMNTKLQFVVNGKYVSWRDVTETYEIDQKSMTTRTMLKITPCHLTPTNFQKMRVKYASQIFSKTVAAAIKTATLTGQLKTSTSLNTAEFIANVNDIFDSLNSRVLNERNPYRQPLSVYNRESVETLENGLKYFEDVEILENNKKRNNIYCVEGFQWTLRSVLLLWSNLKADGTKYLLTSFLNQDPLENFFSVIRNRGGYNPTPTVRQCRLAIQHNMNIRLQMAVDSGNCEIAENKALDVCEVEDGPRRQEDSSQQQEDDDATTDEGHKENTPPNSSRYCNNSSMGADLEACSNVYVAGYLLHKLRKKFSCEECSKSFEKTGNHLTDPRELFLLCKDYSHGDNIQFLKIPSQHFASLIMHLLKGFSDAFKIYKCDPDVSKNIKNYLKDSLERDFPWYTSNENPTCYIHKEFILDLLIKMKMCRHLKWETEMKNTPRQVTSKTPKPHRKISILAKT